MAKKGNLTTAAGTPESSEVMQAIMADQELRSAYEDLKKVRHEMHRQNLIGVHTVGTILNRVRDSKGIEAVKLLAESMGISQQNRDRAMLFADTYSTEQLNDLLNLRLPTGQPVTYEHVRYTLSPKIEPERRRELVTMAVEKGLSSRALREEIKSLTIERAKRKKSKLPRSVISTVDSVASYASKLVGKLRNDLKNSVLDKAKTIRPEDVNDPQRFRQKVVECRLALLSLEAEVHRTVMGLESIMSRLSAPSSGSVSEERPAKAKGRTGKTKGIDESRVTRKRRPTMV